MTEGSVDSRTAIIEGYASKAAELTRTVMTKGFATADGVKGFFAAPGAQASAALARAKAAAAAWWTATRDKLKADRSAAAAKEASA